MSNFSKKSDEAIWKDILERMRAIPNPKNGERFIAFLRERRAAGKVRHSTLGLDALELDKFGQWLGTDKSVMNLQREDLVAYFSSFTALEENTRYRVFVALRLFFRWLHDLDSDEKPPEFKRFKIQRPPKKRLKPQDLITPDELHRMLRYCRTAMERCIIAMLAEAGPRAGEILSFSVGNIERDKWGYVARMPDDGTGLKTGPRPLRLVKSGDFLSAWLQEHALRHKPEAPLFYGLSRRCPYRGISYNTLWSLVHRLKVEAGIQKRIYPHLYRHTAATNLAKKGVQGQFLTMHFGWTDDSDMPATYVHLSEHDVDRRILAAQGVDVGEEQQADGLDKPVCSACQKVNLPQALYCANCEVPLNETAKKIAQEQTRQEMDEGLFRMFYERLAQTPLGQSMGALPGVPPAPRKPAEGAASAQG
jgi:integrase